MILTRSIRSSLFLIAFLVAGAAVVAPSVNSQTGPTGVYYPAARSWEGRKPEEVGMDSALLDQAVAYAKTQASTIPADFSTQVETFGRVLGPLPKMRGDANGIILRHGYIVAEWGDTNRIDPTYSVAKSFLSTLFGLASDR